MKMKIPDVNQYFPLKFKVNDEESIMKMNKKSDNQMQNFKFIETEIKLS